MKNVLKPFKTLKLKPFKTWNAKGVLIPLGLTAAASTANVAIDKKRFGSGMHSSDLGKQTRLTISNKEMNVIMKIVKALEESNLLIKGVNETIKNEAK